MVNFDLKGSKFETAKYIRGNDLLFHLCYLALKDFHIEMYKILKESNNNKDNIFALLKNLVTESEIKRDSAKQNLFELEQNRENINKLCTIRDKFYAHLDEDYENYINQGIPLTDILNCFVAIENSIITLTSLPTLQSYLDRIPSKDELKL